tara:strand:- start:567 stop:917 length:351 start_codon:yes stop_codon:yes gene_type:complete
MKTQSVRFRDAPGRNLTAHGHQVVGFRSLSIKGRRPGHAGLSARTDVIPLHEAGESAQQVLESGAAAQGYFESAAGAAARRSARERRLKAMRHNELRIRSQFLLSKAARHHGLRIQ